MARVVAVIGREKGGGHNRKSAKQHELEGTYRDDRHGKREKPAAQLPKGRRIKLPPPPDDFTEEQKMVWRSMAERLDPKDIITDLDVEAFTLMVQSYTICLQANRSLYNDKSFINKALANGVHNIEEHDLLTYISVTKAGAQIKKRPELDIIALHQKIALYHFSRFGMTPADRLRSGGGSDGGSSDGGGGKDPLKEFEGNDGEGDSAA